MRGWLGLLLALTLFGCNEAPAPTEKFSATALLSSIDAAGFARADRVRPFRFPQDHGGHPRYRNEWWYFTGNLYNETGRRFGYQVTFFRYSLTPPNLGDSRSRWADNPVWMAHVALTDVKGKRHLTEERLVRSGPGLAGVEAEPFQVWVEDWRLSGKGSSFPWQIHIKSKAFDIALDLTPTVGVILQGDRGLSQKGPQAGNASYYYSVPRLHTKGSVTLDGRSYPVSGDSWFDREWGTSALSGEQSGWDWFSLQLDSGSNFMFYRLRDSEGKATPFSAGTLIPAKGQSQPLTLKEITLTPVKWWESSSGRRYPIEWSLQIKTQNRILKIKPVLEDQEMDLSVRYWEGAVDVYEKGRLSGRGYLEMTGY
ncbi:lipocalin-like domain-containing protein [Sedimenticola sp.]|uniref:lipocalin-like domain-containing protein n=1 Tax=Sedimenticola sp. TaxID=1940285 RepID=UPI003D0E5CAB